jgi:hypothetical protein
LDTVEILPEDFSKLLIIIIMVVGGGGWILNRWVTAQ